MPNNIEELMSNAAASYDEVDALNKQRLDYEQDYKMNMELYRLCIDRFRQGDAEALTQANTYYNAAQVDLVNIRNVLSNMKIYIGVYEGYVENCDTLKGQYEDVRSKLSSISSNYAVGKIGETKAKTDRKIAQCDQFNANCNKIIDFLCEITGESSSTKSSSSQSTNTVFNSTIFTPVQYEGTVKVGGIKRDVSRKVYQRNDIDFEYIDPDSGQSNLELMLEGSSPIGKDGKPIELHHVLQEEPGTMAEIHETTHGEYMRILHGLRKKGESFRNDPTLKKQYDNFRRAYWKWRAQQYLEGRK